ncbi:MAG: hypothetical protein ACFFDN_02655 [Candidatus Hodarchaeota archaeon]
MNEAYKIYLKNKWKEAERIAIELGAPSNQVVCSIFDKICQPFYYWNKNEK